MPDAIGPYRVIGQLGEGGQGIVYLGEASDGTRVAIKVLREGVPGDGRFAKEIAAARRVEPFCIAQVLDASLGARPYIVTEYVEGPSLQQAGRHGGADLQRLAVATATALVAIHRAGVVHRDFKPANVLLGRDGPRVIDFGIARAMDDQVTRTSSIVGTPAYMAPEQFAGAPVGPATDVFAWASVIGYAASGTPPFGNDSVVGVLRRIQYDEPQLGGVPEPLRSIVYACLAKDPRARPAMQDVLFRLIGAPAPPPGAPPQGSYPNGPIPAAPMGGGYPGGPIPAAPMGTGYPGGPTPASPQGPGGYPRHPGARRHAEATNPSSSRLLPALVAGGTAMTVTAAAVVAWIWLPLSPGDPSTDTAAIATTATTPPPSLPTSGKQSARTRRPPPTKSTKTPQRTKTTTPATTEPTTSSSPTTRPTTAKPTATSGGVRSVSFTYEGIRLGDCWRSDLNIWATVSASGTYSYRWLVNGQNQGRKQGSSGTKPLLPSIVWKKAGTHQVVLDVITPTSRQKSATVNICDFDKGW
ncbi:serine/threonine protein kinase [Nonomuraea sp. NPDC002799]